MQVAHDNLEWEHQGVLSNADLTCTEHGEMVIDWEKLDYAAARTARQIANIAHALTVSTTPTMTLRRPHLPTSLPRSPADMGCTSRVGFYPSSA